MVSRCALRLDFFPYFLEELCPFFKYLLMHILQIPVNSTPTVFSFLGLSPMVIVRKGWTFSLSSPKGEAYSRCFVQPFVRYLVWQIAKTTVGI